MARLVNLHTAPLDNGHEGPRAARVPPGETGDFNEANPSVKLWGQQRLLVAEGEVLASRAAALGHAPSVAELVALREQLAARDTVIEDLRRRDASRVAEMTRVEDAFGAQAARLAATEAQLADVIAANAAGVATVEQRDATIAALQKRVADLEADLATAPAAGGDTTLDPKAAKPRGR